ncbi:A/G-specific adenine glycosylase [Pseudomarimonas salicorniae]|uniref:Adenine DNA glycosylase n=1 Tax=Pseudomarimonas salicorniae TaxID=2933270 RepID=A0ABT0GL87_9GAMM|nr:A/G-specific adenine glycosylase [Lysobacter sp. CAU 1642]MCK7595276.1 A/G-specific adenine glycosylase [Lysobacter sp. CAU 1642]
MEHAEFAPRLLDWFERHGRHDLPWQHPRSPYRVWVAEIMLQQTQVATVIPYFQRFVDALPTLPLLAAANEDTVLALWSGLGYYSRARNLRAAAKRCATEHEGSLPDDLEALQALPGIGRSTAAAIRAQAFGRPDAILDGNVKRVLCRLFGIEGWPGERRIEQQLWTLAASLMPDERCADYTQAIMDFGATLCSRARPACAICPFSDDCEARLSSRVDSLPTPRPRREVPQRECSMLVLCDPDGRLLLQRREGSGVWQGLWSLPQFEAAEAARDFAVSLGARDDGRPLEPVEHAFTHYRLRIHPLRFDLPGRSAPRIGDNPATRWITRSELLELGLPAPVRRLVSHIKEFR